jgi:hypothetical protein
LVLFHPSFFESVEGQVCEASSQHVFFPRWKQVCLMLLEILVKRQVDQANGPGFAVNLDKAHTISNNEFQYRHIIKI